MKSAITVLFTILAVTLSGIASAETSKPEKSIATKVDVITTQSIAPSSDAADCVKGFANFKIMKACGDANSYPVNALSGMNLN